MQRRRGSEQPGYISILLVLLMVVVTGGLISWWNLWQTDQWMRTELLRHARSAASAIPLDRVAAVSGTVSDRDLPHYQRLKAQLQRLSVLYPEFDFFYLMGRKPDRTIFFFVDSRPDGGEDESKPGQIFHEADANLHRAFDTGIAAIFRPYTSRKDVRVRVCVPLMDPRTNAVQAVFGMDVDAEKWRALAMRSLCVPLGFTVLLMGIVFCGAALLRRRSRLASTEQQGWLMHNAEAVIGAGIMLAITAMVTYEIHRGEKHQRREAFLQMALAKTDVVIETMLDIRNIKLEGLARLFESSDYVDRREFRHYAEFLTRNPAVHAWSWVPRVPAAERQRVEEQARQDGLTDFAFWEFDDGGTRIPVRPREHYYPILYVAPYEGNEAALGFDIGSDPVRLATLEEAMRTGLTTASDPVILVHNDQEKVGMVVLRPIFAPDARDGQEGFVVSVLRPETLLRHSVKPADSRLFQIEMDLYQLGRNARPVFLASTGASDARTLEMESWLHPPFEDTLRLLTPLFAFGKVYVLAARPRPEYGALYPLRASPIAAVSGLAITCILMAFLAFLSRRREVLEREIRERTLALRESQAMLRLVLDSIPVRVFWKDRHSVYLGCNRPFARDAGFAAPEELLGKDDYAMGWRELADRYRADDRMVMESGQSKLGYEEPQFTPDGKRLYLRTNKVPLRNAKGEVVGVLGTYEDISERKQAEEKVRKLSVAVEQSPASVVITDYEGLIEYVNPQFTALTGYSLDEVLGQNPRILKSGETSPETYKELWDTIKGGRKWHGEFHNKKKDGTLYWERALISPIRDDAGNITHFVGLKEDITVQKILEDQLRQAQKMESVGRLAGGVAHDFNNMLQAILGYGDLAMDALPDNHPARGSIEEVQKAAKRSAELTRQLLAFSRRQPIRPIILDINDVVAGMLSMLRRIIGENITLIWKPGMDLWTVQMDPTQVDQVLVNLAANARDAITGAGNLTIETANTTLDEGYCRSHAGFIPGEYVLLAVSDDGCGMDRHTLERLFEPFFTTKDMGRGTGLGLAIVYGIAKQNHGFVNVYSEPGKGTSFKIYLPRACAEAAEALVAAEERPLHGTETVLLVEDEEAILGFGHAILTQYGYTVLTARTPGEALALARRHEGPIHLLITDVVMPEMNGKELKNRLATLLPDLKVLYMSGYTANVIAHHGIIDEGVHFLAKPFSPKSLARIVRDILEQESP